MVCGKTIVTIDTCNTCSVIRNYKNGIVVPTKREWDAYGYIKQIIENELLRFQLGNNAKQYAEEHFYSWEKRMSIEVEVVGSLLN